MRVITRVLPSQIGRTTAHDSQSHESPVEVSCASTSWTGAVARRTWATASTRPIERVDASPAHARLWCSRCQCLQRECRSSVKNYSTLEKATREEAIPFAAIPCG